MDMDNQPDEDGCSGNGIGEDPDYENQVGYCHPPKKYRWKGGMRSPNMQGRPRKSNSRRYYLERIASRKIEIKDGKRSRTVSVLEAIILVIKNRSIAGNVSASRIVEMLRGEPAFGEFDNIPRGVLILGEKMTAEEWEVAAAAYRDRPTDAATEATE